MRLFMPRDHRLYIDDILAAIASIREYVSGMDYSKFSQDKKTQDAVVRNLEVIGEAAKRLPDFIIESTSEMEWRKIIGLRNILTHEYFGISLPIIWDIVKNKLDALEQTCNKIIEDS